MDRHRGSKLIRVQKSLLDKMKKAGIPEDCPGGRLEMIFDQAIIEGMDFSHLFPLESVDKT